MPRAELEIVFNNVRGLLKFLQQRADFPLLTNLLIKSQELEMGSFKAVDSG